MLSPGPPQFRTTRWSLVARTRGSHPDRAAALETLCRAYWRPLYAFLRRDGHPPEEAEDLVQGLLADLLERDDFAVADPERGRFRTFLLAALKNYRSKWREKADAVKRGGRMTRRPLDFGAAEIAYRLEPGGRPADRVFERQWALATIEHVLAEVERKQSEAGRGAWFAALRGTLTGEAAAPYAEIAAALGSTPGAVKAAAARLRRDFRSELDVALADGIDEADAAAERAALFAALGQ